MHKIPRRPSIIFESIPLVASLTRKWVPGAWHRPALG